MRRAGELLRPLWVRLGTIAIVLAVTAVLVLALGRPTLFSAANASATSSERGYHCHPHPTPKSDHHDQNAGNQNTGNGDRGKHESCKPNHCC